MGDGIAEVKKEVDEIKEDIKDVTKVTTENSLNIRELITIVTQQTKDSDKFIKHLDNLIPLHHIADSISKRLEIVEKEQSEGIKPKTLKELLKYSALVIIGFGTWIALMFFAVDKTITAHIELQKATIANIEKNADKQSIKIEILNNKTEELQKKSDIDGDKINDNKNQITYLKGRIKK